MLLNHVAVEQAVAFAVPHPTLGEDVAAAVVFHAGHSASESDLHEYVYNQLPPFKVPSRIVILTSIPKGPTGKLQRIGLYEKLKDQLRCECVSPRTTMEEILLELWRDVLPCDQIGVYDNFFGAGGDSLTAARLATRINARFELDLAVTTVFRAPSIAAQAVLVELALLDQLERE